MSTAAGMDSASFAAAPVVRPDAGHAPDSDGVDPQLVQETRNQIRTLVQEITRLSESDAPLNEFYAGLLTRVVSALAASGGAIWTLTEEKRIEVAYRISFEAPELVGPQSNRHTLLLKRIVRDQQPLAAPPKSGFPDDAEAGNPTDQLLLLAPIVIDREVAGLIEVLQRPGAGPTTQRGYLRFLSQMGDLAGNYLRNHRLRQFAERQALWQTLEQFLSELHRSLDLDATAYAVVNEGRRVVDCDRVSLATRHGAHCRLLAVSGLDSVDRRTQEATKLARLLDAVVQTCEPFWYAGDNGPLAPQIEGPLEAYIDRSHSKAIGIVPLRNMETQADAGPLAHPPFAALVFERMGESRWTESHRHRAAAVVRYATPALAHALQHDRIFLKSLWTWLGDWRKRLDTSTRLKLSAAGAALAAGIAALALVPASFDIAARGKVLPANRWDIFAAEAGTVIHVPVSHGQAVAEGELLAELSNTEIDVQLTELLGRQRVAQEQLEASQRAILDSGHGGRPRLSVAEENRLGGEVLQLRQTLIGLAEEIKLVRQKQQQLAIRAPHAGEVVTWQVEQKLLRRVVQPGQALMTVVDPHGPWELELYLPERRLKHVDAAIAQGMVGCMSAAKCTEEEDGVFRSAHTPYDVTFMLSSLPGREFTGRVVEIERAAEVRGEEGNTVLVRVELDSAELPPLRSDTTVTAKLHCGRRSLGYVWFCDLLETVQTSVLFWL